MDPDTFDCDVCYKPITGQDAIAHIILHQTQLLQLANRLNNISPIHRQATITTGQNRSPPPHRTSRDYALHFQCPECPHNITKSRLYDMIRHYATHYDCKAVCPDCRFEFKTKASLFFSHRCSRNPSASSRKARNDLRKEIERHLEQNYNLRSRRNRPATTYRNNARPDEPSRTLPTEAPTSDAISPQVRQDTHVETLYNATVATDGIANEHLLLEAPGRHAQSTLPIESRFQQPSQVESGRRDGYIESHFHRDGYIESHFQGGIVEPRIPSYDTMEMQFQTLTSQSGFHGQIRQAHEEHLVG